MITLIASASRHFADHGWLQTHWHFSFSDYHDPTNIHWSVLRVFNDDVIQGGGGFPMHPHRDMEIITYVIDGQLEHQDALGNRGIVHPGEVQVMSAGSGITHSEFNPSPDKPVRLLQLWLFPRHKNNPPRWDQRSFSAAQRSGKLLAVVSGGDVVDTLSIDQDAVVYVSRLAAGQSVSHSSAAGRHAYLFIITGQIRLNDQPMAAGDQARVAGETRLQITAEAATELLLLDLP